MGNHDVRRKCNNRNNNKDYDDDSDDDDDDDGYDVDDSYGDGDSDSDSDSDDDDDDDSDSDSDGNGNGNGDGTSSTTIPTETQYNKQQIEFWNKMFPRFVAYKEQHGNTNNQKWLSRARRKRRSEPNAPSLSSVIFVPPPIRVLE